MNTELQQQVQDFLVPTLHPAFILLFGSYAKGNQRSDSDLDMAFLCKKRYPFRLSDIFNCSRTGRFVENRCGYN
ncbi:nucleotidyltransferase domain-containing protein [Gracilibacillus phocaeensis]|uniref:nucleotidyltransferase domain-containing protein n=1 Tax=Gracilibacillus phocaeensis TaxID=2042304 RepID=UPI002570493F|nr:nucleotidyltransferase domain-containing protein [Gracilibacillus phocaeensis]